MKPTERFSNRVENYLRYRPHYPPEIIPFLEKEIGLTASSVIADIGSGTGFSAELFLENGNSVYGIEPNKEMREAGEQLLQRFSKFHSVDASAEETKLPDQSIDTIIAGQAFHWFDVGRSIEEFSRILKPNGWIVLLWNERQLDSTPFLREYEDLLKKFGTDYPVIAEHTMRHKIEELFGSQGFAVKRFANTQTLDYRSLEGRLLSSSYTPTAESPSFRPMLNELQNIFKQHQRENAVEILYDTDLYYGKL